MELIKGDGPGEPMDRWTVTRTWRGVEALTAVEAVLISRRREHDDVRTVREDFSPRLFDTEVVSLTICRFTGERQALQEHCPARLERLHPDVYCWRSLVAVDAVVDALPAGEATAGLAFTLGALPEDLRVPHAWNPLQTPVPEARDE